MASAYCTTQFTHIEVIMQWPDDTVQHKYHYNEWGQNANNSVMMWVLFPNMTHDPESRLTMNEPMEDFEFFK